MALAIQTRLFKLCSPLLKSIVTTNHHRHRLFLPCCPRIYSRGGVVSAPAMLNPQDLQPSHTRYHPTLSRAHCVLSLTRLRFQNAVFQTLSVHPRYTLGRTFLYSKESFPATDLPSPKSAPNASMRVSPAPIRLSGISSALYPPPHCKWTTTLSLSVIGHCSKHHGCASTWSMSMRFPRSRSSMRRIRSMLSSLMVYGTRRSRSMISSML